MHIRKNAAVPEFPRFGMVLRLPERMSQVQYLGYGPCESYIDKHRASWYGSFLASVGALHEDYIRPQENGSHWNCRSLCVSGEGKALKVLAVNAPFSFNASYYTSHELTRAAHNYELKPSGHTILTLDFMQNGIGSNSCGPRLMEQYRLNALEMNWAFRLEWS